MKNLFLPASLGFLVSCSHYVPLVTRVPSSSHDVLLSIDLSSKELRVVENGQTIGEFKIHMKDPALSRQCKTTPPIGKFPAVKKDLIYKSEKYGVIAHYAIGYRVPTGNVYLVKEDDGSKNVHGGHCGVMLSDGQGSKLFALIEHTIVKNITVEIED